MTLLLNRSIQSFGDLTQGLTWEQVRESVRQDDQFKKDITSSRLFFDQDNNLRVDWVPHQLTKFGMSQLLQRFTPSGARYIKKMLNGDEKSRKLAQDCINHGIQQAVARSRGSENAFLIRTRQLPNGQKIVRAVLSDRYQVLDNREILSGLAENLSSNLIPARVKTSDSGFELVVIDRLLSRDVAKDDRNYIANVYRNSEVGNGSISCLIGIFRALCLNGMSMPVSSYGISVPHVSSQDIQELTYVSIKQGFDNATTLLDKLTASRDNVVPAQLLKPTIELISKDGRWSAPFEESVQYNALSEEKTQYGIIQAITHSAKQLSHEKFKETETFAGKLLMSDFNRYVRQAEALTPIV